MAAAANKPGPVHYTLAIFVVITVILGITNYMAFRGEGDAKAETLKLTQENQALNAAQKNLDDDIQALKKLVGIKLDKVDDRTNPQNPATVVTALNTEIQNYGKDLAGKDVQETIRKMREAVDAIAADRDSKTQKVAALEREMLALKSQYQNQVDSYSGQTKTYEREKLDVIGDRDEKVNAKIQEIARLERKVRDSETQLEEEKDSREKERTKADNTIAGLELRIDSLRERIDNLEKMSFEAADGAITSIEYSNHSVLINLGEDDFLKSRMTFSVFSKENLGVGRGPEDIKGKIEVTRVLGPHLAEAKIIDDDLYRPIVGGDLIYTPIWNPGMVEKISFIGDIDLDGDGRSDREQLHQMLAVAGCIIDNEVNDDGDRIPEDGKITVNTRFFVKGNIPDLTTAVTDLEKTKAEKVNAWLTKMEKEARTNGVRVIKLSDFLAYIGFHSKRRTFLPGQERPFALKAGSGGVLGRNDSKDRTSNGNVSGAFTKGRKSTQETPAGDSSKSFSGDKK